MVVVELLIPDVPIIVKQDELSYMNTVKLAEQALATHKAKRKELMDLDEIQNKMLQVHKKIKSKKDEYLKKQIIQRKATFGQGIKPRKSQSQRISIDNLYSLKRKDVYQLACLQ